MKVVRGRTQYGVAYLCKAFFVVLVLHAFLVGACKKTERPNFYSVRQIQLHSIEEIIEDSATHLAYFNISIMRNNCFPKWDSVMLQTNLVSAASEQTLPIGGNQYFYDNHTYSLLINHWNFILLEKIK